jgi:mycothiol synthase
MKEKLMTTRHSDGSSALDTPNGTAWTFRSYREGDIPGIVALINAAYAVDRPGHTWSDEELALSFGQPFSDPPKQVIVVEGPAVEGVPEGAFAGYGRIMNYHDKASDERIYQMGLKVHPSARGKDLEKALAGRLLEIARANEAQPEIEPAGKVSLIAAIREEDVPVRALYNEMGLREVRQGWIMTRSLNDPIAEPARVEGVTMRNYRRPEDNIAALYAYNSSFIDHFEFHAFPQEVWDYHMSTPEVRVDLSWLAEVDAEPGTLAGFCICEIKSEANERSGLKEGWIALLGTVRGWRGKGLGRSLLLHGLRSLKEAGMDTALLGVDSESLTGANRLYESVGFTVRDHEVMFKSPLSDVKA